MRHDRGSLDVMRRFFFEFLFFAIPPKHGGSVANRFKIWVICASAGAGAGRK